MGSDIMENGKATLANIPRWTRSVTRRLPRVDMDMTDATSLRNFVADKPLVVGAVGLGLGALVGALLPRRFGSRNTVSRRSSRSK